MTESEAEKAAEFSKADIPQWADTYATLHGSRLSKDYGHRKAISEAADVWYDIGYAAGRAASRWVPVEEELPDCHHFVLCLYCSNPKHVIPAIRNEDGTWRGILNSFTADAFTHWQYLPEAPV